MKRKFLSIVLAAVTVITAIDFGGFNETKEIILADEIEVTSASEVEIVEIGQMTNDYEYVETESSNIVAELAEAVDAATADDTEDALEQIETNQEFASGRLMLGLNSDVEALDAVAKTEVMGDGFVVLQYDSAEAAKEAYDYYLSLDAVDYVEVDSDIMEISEYMSWGYNDYSDTNKSINLIPFKETYESSYSTNEIDVAVIDTGLSAENAIFNGRISEKKKDFTGENENAIDGNGHGTHCSGTIVEATPSNVKIMPVKVMSDDGRGNPSQLISGIIWATDNGAKVINLSISGQSSRRIEAVDNAIKYAYDHDVIVCVAAGNKAVDAENVVPANSPYTITVGAVDKNGNLASFSNYGDTLDVVAPGVSIKSCGISGSQCVYGSGTSQASPHVAATAALFCCMDNSYDYDSFLSVLKRSGEKNGFSDAKLNYYGPDGNNYSVSRLLLGNKTFETDNESDNEPDNENEPSNENNTENVYSSIFDPIYYLNTYADIKRAFGDDYNKALEHFINFGMSEGRQGRSDFDVYAYRARYVDLQNAFGTNWKALYTHYLNCGINEHRDGKPGDSYTVDFKDINGKSIGSTIVQYGHTASTATINKNGATMTFSAPIDTIVSDKSITVAYHYYYNGVDYAPVFDADYYFERYADIRNAFGTDGNQALAHFINYGMNEGRNGNSEFNVFSYRGKYKDLQNAFGTNLKSYYNHYLYYGLKENRNANPNSSTYTVTFKDGDTVIKTQTIVYGHGASAPELYKNGAILSWDKDYSCVTSNITVNAKWKYIYNGVDYWDIFDADYYLNKYSDLRNAFGTNVNSALVHFVNCGMNEGRQAKSTFNVHSYKNRYSDLQKAFGNDLKSYYLHYIYYGKNEGRTS